MGGREALIEAEDLAKVYDSGAASYPALRGLSFRVGAGEFVSIMGPSGCGKSTLLNILGMLDRPSAGSYRFEGREVAALSDARRTMLRRQAIGFVFQSFNLLPRLCALENVCLPMAYAGVDRPARRARAQELLARVGLEGKEQKTPLELSGGERQRVGVARALANRPRLLLADEPTGNLDSRTSAEILELFLDLHAEGATVVIVTHDRGIAARAQRVLHIQDGKMLKEERQ